MCVASILEPRTSQPNARLRAIEQITEAGIPVGVLLAPVIPGLTDHDMPQLLQSAKNAGVRFVGQVVLRLPYSNKELFEQWVTEHFPNRKDKILNRVRALRGGELNANRVRRPDERRRRVCRTNQQNVPHLPSDLGLR